MAQIMRKMVDFWKIVLDFRQCKMYADVGS